MSESPAMDDPQVPGELAEETEDAQPADATGPDTRDLDEDPAYNPQDEGLRDIKGG